MSSVKPDIEREQVIALLEGHFGGPASEIAPIASGLIARTFSFRVNDQRYIIRFQADNMLAHFEKERFISEQLVSPQVPIPPIVHIGRLRELHYAISIEVPGRTLERLSAQEYRQALPSVVETILAIHQTDISKYCGHGLIDGKGTGISPSWHSSLAAIADEDPEWDFYGKWHSLFETTCLEQDVFDRIYNQMVRLFEFCPEERYLVHGGYGFGNVLVQDAHVTGVVDWMDARYGDFVYDIAWLDYFYPHYDHQQLCFEYYTRRGVSIPFFQERLLCYMCYIALDGLRFFAKTNNPDGYQWTRQRILSLLSGEQT